MKKVIALIFIILLLLVVGYNQYQPASNDIISITDSIKDNIPDDKFKEPLKKYFKESKKADNNDLKEIVYYEDIPDEVVEEYMRSLDELNIRKSKINGKDGVSYTYKYFTENKKYLEISVIKSIVTGNKISLSFESPIID
ncbi:hypothetical protein BW731_02165 [Vagococcus martis]|uniref:Uncharacterized protein n=1 Tax=Vagococcus martis TaxID=1768210 RepID=A0A1V4DF74_9ENTE|nr:hypothetical protein [Vagococcus martis]OPF87093.1 hypothetical protein BW731_02165 [Vagococcus martis]